MKKTAVILFILFVVPAFSLAQQSYEDSLKKVVAEYKNEGEVVRAYNDLAFEYTRKDPAKAKTYFHSALAIAKKMNNSKKLTGTYGNLISLLHNMGKSDSAEFYLDEIKKIYDRVSGVEKDTVASNYFAVAALYYKRTGAYQKAIPFFENAIAYNVKINAKESVAGQTLNLGNTYLLLGNYQKATEQHLKALKIFEEIGSERGISFCYESLSNSFIQLKQYNQALTYANRSVKIKTTLNDKRGLGNAESGLGNIYFGMNQLDKSLVHFNTSLNIARELKNLPDEQGNYQSIAKVYKAKKDFKQAASYFNQSKILAIQLKDTSSVRAIEAELIAIQNNANATIAAESKLQSNIELFKERGDLTRQASGYKNMVDFYVANKEFDKALEYNNKYYTAIDSIENNDLQLQVKKMEELYTVEKKEKEITLLKKDQELSQAKLQRQKTFQYGAVLLLGLVLLSGFLLFNRFKLRQRMKQLELRNQIAADLHDEVGSSLSSINMLSQMATQQSDVVKQKDILIRMSSNAKETMDKMGDIVWMIKPGETEAGSLKQRMERFAYEICSSKNIELQMQLDELEKLKLTIDQRKNVYLIFKEAINNAVKYSGTEKIETTASLQNNKLVLLIKDFGKGFDSSLVKKGNGLDNMHHRAKELNGKISIQSGIEGGTSVILAMSA